MKLKNHAKLSSKRTKSSDLNFWDCFLYYNSTRRQKLVEKAIFDFELVVVLAFQSLVGQNYKHTSQGFQLVTNFAWKSENPTESLDNYVALLLLCMVLRILRFITCSVFAVDSDRRHSFGITRFSAIQWSYESVWNFR